MVGLGHHTGGGAAGVALRLGDMDQQAAVGVDRFEEVGGSAQTLLEGRLLGRGGAIAGSSVDGIARILCDAGHRAQCGPITTIPTIQTCDRSSWRSETDERSRA